MTIRRKTVDNRAAPHRLRRSPHPLNDVPPYRPGHCRAHPRVIAVASYEGQDWCEPCMQSKVPPHVQPRPGDRLPDNPKHASYKVVQSDYVKVSERAAAKARAANTLPDDDGRGTVEGTR